MNQDMSSMIRTLIMLLPFIVAVSCAEMKRAAAPVSGMPSWMELPAADDDSYGYYTHSFTMKGNKYRNYSFAWSQKDLVSVWVAYPLCGMYTERNVDRTDAWRYDPLLGEDLSPAPFTGYAGDYARGHQIPSADRMCCKAANEQTFYGTNIMPQMDEHNEGVWNRLESHVRSVAEKSDTVYVVTGCVVEGSDELTSDSDGKAITVPVAFFKALLRYEKGSESAEWSGAAFYTEHRNYGKKVELKSLSMSIDELEKKTGLDFFVNLPSAIGQKKAEAVEAQNPASSEIWKLN